jgi:hypothetical protein
MEDRSHVAVSDIHGPKILVPCLTLKAMDIQRPRHFLNKSRHLHVYG